MSATTDRSLGPGGNPPKGWVRPAFLAGLAALALGGLAYGVNSLIEDYHDGIALRGLKGKPSPVRLIVAGEPMVIPANMIRFRSERRGGPVDKVDLLFHWPSLEGFSEARSEDFRDAAQTAPLVFVTISSRDSTLDSNARLDALYSRFFTGPDIEGPANLSGRALTSESGYGGEIVFYAKGGSQPFVARCIAEQTPEIPATCIRDVKVGQGLSMLYRFNRAYLPDWKSMDDRLRRLTSQFFRKL